MTTSNWLIVFLFTSLLFAIVFRIFKLIRTKLRFKGWFVFVACMSLLMMFYFLFTYGYVTNVAKGEVGRTVRGFTYNAYLFFLATSGFTVALAIAISIVSGILKIQKR
ncbi:MAG: hypothetical protein EOO10_05235 [Chitinophagaceae bacterium]|nr:MAG: hypothetical protein EOO10_05235 [Chitinophagaceae bacterium]